MQALLRYPRAERRAVAQAWARRSQAVQAARRMARGPDAETVRWRAGQDARGQVLRQGVTFFGDGRVVPWSVRRSLVGRVDQLDIVVEGKVWRTCGARTVRRVMGLFQNSAAPRPGSRAHYTVPTTSAGPGA